MKKYSALAGWRDKIFLERVKKLSPDWPKEFNIFWRCEKVFCLGWLKEKNIPWEGLKNSLLIGQKNLIFFEGVKKDSAWLAGGMKYCLETQPLLCLCRLEKGCGKYSALTSWFYLIYSEGETICSTLIGYTGICDITVTKEQWCHHSHGKERRKMLLKTLPLLCLFWLGKRCEK